MTACHGVAPERNHKASKHQSISSESGRAMARRGGRPKGAGLRHRQNPRDRKLTVRKHPGETILQKWAAKVQMGRCESLPRRNLTGNKRIWQSDALRQRLAGVQSLVSHPRFKKNHRQADRITKRGYSLKKSPIRSRFVRLRHHCPGRWDARSMSSDRFSTRSRSNARQKTPPP